MGEQYKVISTLIISITYSHSRKGSDRLLNAEGTIVVTLGKFDLLLSLVGDSSKVIRVSLK